MISFRIGTLKAATIHIPTLSKAGSCRVCSIDISAISAKLPQQFLLLFHEDPLSAFHWREVMPFENSLLAKKLQHGSMKEYPHGFLFWLAA
jgi:hypothetical protein